MAMEAVTTNRNHNSALDDLSQVTQKIDPAAITRSLDHELSTISESDTTSDHLSDRLHLLPSASQGGHRQCSVQTAGRSPSRAGTTNNAARERSRVRTLRAAFLELQRTLPAVPRDTKLSKLDVLVLATTYIAQLTSTLSKASGQSSVCHSRHHDTSSDAVTTDVRQSRCRRNSHDQHYPRPPAAANVTPLPQRQFLCSSSSRSGGGGDDESADRKDVCGRQGGGGPADKSVLVSGLRSHGYLHPVKNCPTYSDLRERTWPAPTTEEEKLFGPLADLQTTAAFIQGTGLDI